MCADDPEYRHYTDIKQLPPHRLQEIRRFFEDCIPICTFQYMYICLHKSSFCFKYVMCTRSLILEKTEEFLDKLFQTRRMRIKRLLSMIFCLQTLLMRLSSTPCKIFPTFSQLRRRTEKKKIKEIVS